MSDESAEAWIAQRTLLVLGIGNVFENDDAMMKRIASSGPRSGRRDMTLAELFSVSLS